jgi:phage shock protein A
MTNSNPILQMLGNTQSQSLASNINSFLSMFNSIKNPQAMLQQMIANNDPKITQIMKMVNQNGGDP